MTWYREIEGDNDLTDLGISDDDRQLIGFNIRAVKRPSDTFLQELLSLLVVAGVGTFNVDIFLGSKAVVPSEGGPFLVITATGGAAALRTQNAIRAVVPAQGYTRPSATIQVRSPQYAEAEAMARAALNALVNVRNREVVP